MPSWRAGPLDAAAAGENEATAARACGPGDNVIR
jgi:hypothetical protein